MTHAALSPGFENLIDLDAPITRIGTGFNLKLDLTLFAAQSRNDRSLRTPAVGPTVCEGLIAPRTQLMELETDRQISASGL
jgi:hypothetical protein